MHVSYKVAQLHVRVIASQGYIISLGRKNTANCKFESARGHS